MSDSTTPLPTDDRFDKVLIIVLIVVGVWLGIAVWHTGYLVMGLLPIAAVMLSLVGAAVTRRRRFLAAFSSVTAVNVSWPVLAIASSFPTNHSEWFGLLQLMGLAWALPLGIVFYILWATRD